MEGVCSVLLRPESGWPGLDRGGRPFTASSESDSVGSLRHGPTSAQDKEAARYPTLLLRRGISAALGRTPSRRDGDQHNQTEYTSVMKPSSHWMSAAGVILGPRGWVHENPRRP